MVDIYLKEKDAMQNKKKRKGHYADPKKTKQADIFDWLKPDEELEDNRQTQNKDKPSEI